MLKYSVIVPVYKAERFLADCLDSVLAQSSGAPYEMILVDDGSPDGSGAICDDYAARYSNIRVIHSENHGVSHARNLGIRAAEGEYLLFLDADDLWEPELLAQVDSLTGEKPDMVVFGNTRLMEDGSIVPGMADPVIPDGESGEAYLRRMFDACAAPRAYSCCYAIRREFLNQNEIRFREDMKVSEDFDLLMRCFGAARQMRGTAAQLYCYRCNDASASRNISVQKLMNNIESKAAYFRKYPVAPMANIYADNALLVCGLPRAEVGDAVRFLKENRDIWQSVSQPPLKVGRLLVSVLGDYKGAKCYRAIRSVTRRMQGRK